MSLTFQPANGVSAPLPTPLHRQPAAKPIEALRRTWYRGPLLNRWIVPLKKKIDYLTLQTGKKLEIPFDQIVMSSTNLNPADLTDEAFQRRVRFRIPVEDPTVDQFCEVFRAVCKGKNVPFDFESFPWLVDTWWKPYDRPFRMVQPRDLVNQLIAIAKYLDRPPSMDPDLLNRACKSLFVIETLSVNSAASKV